MRYIFSTADQHLHIDVEPTTANHQPALDIKFSVQTTEGQEVGLNQVNAGLSPEIRTAYEQALKGIQYYHRNGHGFEIDTKSAVNSAFHPIPTHIVVAPQQYMDSAQLEDVVKGILTARGLKPSQVEQVAGSRDGRSSGSAR